MNNTCDRPQTLGEEIANSISHGIALIGAITAIPILIIGSVKSGKISVIVSAIIFGVTMMLLYLASTIYHSLPKNKAKRIFVIFDHCAIFLLIAGTYTPFTFGALYGAWGWSIFGIVWGLAVFGIIFKIILGTKYQFVSTSIYLIMGWTIIIAVKPLLISVPTRGLIWLLAGGLFYTFGIPFFLADNKIKYAHFTWHLFVISGSFCHFMAIYYYSNF